MLASGRLGRSAILYLAAIGVLASCGRDEPHPSAARDGPHASTERAYHAAPALTSVETSREGRVTLLGTAQPGARMRLAMPDGRAVLTNANAEGRWRVALPADADMRFFSLSMVDGGRTVQSEGYIAVAPDAAALLRAGAGAVPLFRTDGVPRLAALDFDRKGGAVITAQAAPGELVRLLIDGAPVANGRVGMDGRFIAALNEPLGLGDHRLDLIGQKGSATAGVTISEAAPLPSIPLRAERLPNGWRVDWMTPAGGVQSTVLFIGGGR